MTEQELIEAQSTEIAQTETEKLLQLAVDKDLDVDKLAQLIELRNAEIARQGRMEFIAALNDFKRVCPPLYKTKEVAYADTRYEYLPLDRMAKIIDPLLSERDIVYRWVPHFDREGFVGFSCDLLHASGHEEIGLPLYGAPDTRTETNKTGKKNPLHADSSTGTTLKRLTLVAALGITTAAPDLDGRGDEPTHPPLTEQQVADLEALMDEVGADRVKFLKWLKVDSLAHIPADRYPAAVAGLEAKRRQS